MDKRMRVLRGPGLRPGRETLYISDVDLGLGHSTLSAEDRDQRVCRVAMDRFLERVSDAEARSPPAARVAPFRAC
eukprot:11432834-Alexandrium_andersonii.AAC.1